MSFAIRPLEAADVPAARRLFASGMSETLIWGLRRELLRPTLPKATIAFAIFAPSLYLPKAILCALCALGVFAFAGPRKIASDYISKSLSDDMLDPMTRYRSKRGSGFWVAVSGSGEVIGTDDEVESEIVGFGRAMYGTLTAAGMEVSKPKPCAPRPIPALATASLVA